MVRGDGDGLIDLDLSPDGRTLAFIDDDGTLRFVDTRTRRPAAPPVPSPGPGALHHRRGLRFDQLRFSPDGSRLAVGGCKPVVLDAATHRVLARLQIGSDRTSSTPCASRPTGARSSPSVGFPAGGAQLVRASTRARGRRLGGEARDARADGFATLMPTRDGRRS